MCSSVSGLQQDFACCQCRLCRRLSLFVFPLFLTGSFAFFPSPTSITSPVTQLLSLFNMIPPLSLSISFCLSPSVSLSFYLFHWLAGSLFINLMQFGHFLFNSLLQQSCSVKESVAHRDPTKRKTCIFLRLNILREKMFLPAAPLHPPLFSVH